MSTACAGDLGVDRATDRPGETIATGFMPSEVGVTDRTDGIISIWNGSWIAALLIAGLVWGLTLWAVVAYRKRKNDNALPVQLRYHVPLELLYTIIPVIIIGVIYFYTVERTIEITETDGEADVHIEAYGKQWSWDFNYLDDDVYDTHGRISLTGESGVEETLPTLYLPVGQTVEFDVTSRDVQHSFWIPAFLYKMDMIPGRTNTFQVTPEREGMYQGKCAELCGEFHSEMLFNVAVVDQETYDDHMDELREAGQTGRYGEELDREYNPEGRQGPAGEEA